MNDRPGFLPTKISSTRTRHVIAAISFANHNGTIGTQGPAIVHITNSVLRKRRHGCFDGSLLYPEDTLALPAMKGADEMRGVAALNNARMVAYGMYGHGSWSTKALGECRKSVMSLLDFGLGVVDQFFNLPFRNHGVASREEAS